MVLAISSCLECILQVNDLPRKLPPAMNAKMKIATILADHIKNLGYYGDMGYSTILYSSELERRKILIFLIEKLPRDPSKVPEVNETSYFLNMLKKIDENVQLHVRSMWIPSSLLYYGFRKHISTCYTKHSFGNSIPLSCEVFTDIDSHCETEGKFKTIAKFYQMINFFNL